jgi:hypothetical protein
MPVIIVGNEKNFTALRSRIFSGRVSTAAAKEVSDAIAAATRTSTSTSSNPGRCARFRTCRVKVDDLSLDDTTSRSSPGSLNPAPTRSTAFSPQPGAERDRRRAQAAASDPLVEGRHRRGRAKPGPRRRRQGSSGRRSPTRKAAKDRATALQDASTTWNAERDAQGFLVGDGEM